MSMIKEIKEAVVILPQHDPSMRNGGTVATPLPTIVLPKPLPPSSKAVGPYGPLGIRGPHGHACIHCGRWVNWALAACTECSWRGHPRANPAYMTELLTPESL